MSDSISILYYTANRVPEHFAEQVRAELLKAAGELPIISVSQTPLDFGENLVVGEIGQSIWNCYRQLWMGARIAETRYVAMAEDDSLYVPEHFTHRPTADDVFAYNEHRFVLTQRRNPGTHAQETIYYWRRRAQMAMCICRRELLVETLRERFEKWPKPITDAEAKAAAWGEPGRYEHLMGLPMRKRQYFRTDLPCVTVNHGESLMGRRQVQPTDTIVDSIDPWGKASTLWARLYGEHERRGMCGG